MVDSTHKRWIALLLLTALVSAGLYWARAREAVAEKVPLTQLYTPTFTEPPPPEPASQTLNDVRAALGTPDGVRFFRSLMPGQAGVLWLALFVALAVAFDARNLRNARNLDLLLILTVGFCFFDILGFLERLADSTSRNLMDWTFLAIGLLTSLLLVRALIRVVQPARAPWQPNLDARTLAMLAAALFVLDVLVALVYPPDDAGYFINIGAQRLRERLMLPYGDPLLTATPAAAYGPVLYVAHVPFQWLLAPTPVNPSSYLHPPLGSDATYYLPPLLATKLCVIAFHAMGVAALFAAARRLGGRERAWAAVALYCGSAFVLGVGNGDYTIGGMTFASHVAPAAVTLAGFAAFPWPTLSGGLLAVATGVLFYPAFMLPAWLGFYWPNRAQVVRFVAGFGLAALFIGAGVILRSAPANGRSVVGTVLHDTLGHQESPNAYGSSPFGLWGRRSGVRGWLMRPVLAGRAITRPAVLGFFALVTATFFLARGRGPGELALLLATVAMGAQLWKIHATATYVAWYHPFLLLGLFAARPTPPPSR